MGRLEGKIALVTGAARGTGEQVARLIDTRHIFLALVDEATAELVPILQMRDGVRDTQLDRTSISDRVGLMSIVAVSGHTIRTDDYIAECARQGVEPFRAAVPLPNWIGVPGA